MDRSERTVMNGADIIVDFLIRQNVPYLFGLCGHGNVGFLDAAFKAQNRIRTISVHHEQTAGHMADAYFKVRHEPVATFTSCGPGSANLVVALAAAMMDSSAFFAITGNVPTSQFNRQPFQETGRYFQGDFPSVIRPYVKRSYQPTRVDMVPLAVRQALGADAVRPPGPGQPRRAAQRVRRGGRGDAARRRRRASSNGAPGNPAALSAALDMLLRGRAAGDHRRPGRAAGRGRAGTASIRRARRGIPVVTSPNGKGAINERHALAFGSIGRNGTLCRERGDEATPTSSWRSASPSTTAPPAPGWTATRCRSRRSRLIQIDIDPAEIGRNYPGRTADPRLTRSASLAC